jgi:hypothetical protein
MQNPYNVVITEKENTTHRSGTKHLNISSTHSATHPKHPEAQLFLDQVEHPARRSELSLKNSLVSLFPNVLGGAH